ncbi:hypothetical protein AWB74_01636 [Caballeronia arvi]|uniref:Uncharacterized protein n=1 Tax=Caballeronia arvi TaxID=1777135 RepID=A0A158HBF5_9BURK|nr:hypothetical protein AWB74_01636 [Caballeronia arvi]
MTMTTITVPTVIVTTTGIDGRTACREAFRQAEKNPPKAGHVQLATTGSRTIGKMLTACSLRP